MNGSRTERNGGGMFTMVSGASLPGAVITVNTCLLITGAEAAWL